MTPDLFGFFERNEFPASVCTVQNPREPEVMDAPTEEVYLCVVVDRRWPTQCRLEHLRPYTAKDGDEVLFGWLRIDFDGYINHATKSIHLDNERVVAWKRVDAVIQFGPKEWSE